MKVDIYTVTNPPTGNSFNIVTTNIDEARQSYRDAIRSDLSSHDPLVIEARATQGYNVLVWELIEQGVDYKRKHSPEAKQKMRKAWEKRDPMSKDTKKKISDSLKGKAKSSTHKENIKQAMLNPKVSYTNLVYEIPTPKLTPEEALQEYLAVPEWEKSKTRSFSETPDSLTREEYEAAGIEEPLY